MNFLRHPLYTALALGACAWLPYANMQGKSFVRTFSPVYWASGSGGSSSHSSYHSSGHFSHK